ncbi:MAG: hypothetical protein M1823_008279, partial [Watsoniomyces obsoletus]
MVEDGNVNGKSGDLGKGKPPSQADKPVFTTTSSTVKPTKGANDPKSDSTDDVNGWMHDALAAIGLTENTPWHQDNSRRPPGSGNIEWVLAEDWDDDALAKTNTRTQTRTAAKSVTSSMSSTRGISTTSRRAGGDDFVIGVQDWRDTELIAPKPTASH